MRWPIENQYQCFHFEKELLRNGSDSGYHSLQGKYLSLHARLIAPEWSHGCMPARYCAPPPPLKALQLLQILTFSAKISLRLCIYLVMVVFCQTSSVSMNMDISVFITSIAISYPQYVCWFFTNVFRYNFWRICRMSNDFFHTVNSTDLNLFWKQFLKYKVCCLEDLGSTP